MTGGPPIGEARRAGKCDGEFSPGTLRGGSVDDRREKKNLSEDPSKRQTPADRVSRQRMKPEVDAFRAAVSVGEMKCGFEATTRRL